ncbi:hypothetical protein [Blautia hansenii]|uniref:Uncharacterized protein n=1 Tax=Blautia hansenii DSM 20583 TaxID=537007 RepID=C9L7U9_BLAHA|nr:hypothetical protein [Blautia hansenii]ASM69747.1 cell division protein [Blautia hansenii DSM 20583]EEX21844.1 hypothetical protein BLAHAN_05469 [Blautia hansenii DSM 20583]UWO09497.1 cell division protein [Blautia hansenii DSM 20583]
MSKEAKSLRWLANMFPLTNVPLDETDKISNAIHIYCTAGAEKIDQLQKENEILLEYLKNKGVDLNDRKI